MDETGGTDTAVSAESLWVKDGGRIVSAMALLVLALGTVVYRLFEDWGWVDAFYFSAVALTTVGFGDLTPTSSGTKLFTVFYIFSGISLITAYLNVLLKRRSRQLAERKGVSVDASPPDEP